MQKLYSVLFSFLTFSGIIYGQKDASALLIDHLSREAVSYANIGVLGGTNGTVSDLSGHFELKSLHPNAQIKISCIGYSGLQISVVELLAKDSIYMVPISYDTPESFITASRIQSIIKGKKIDDKNNVIAWTHSNLLGLEIGSRIKLDKPVIITSAHLGFNRMTVDSILLRLNIYHFSDGVLGDKLLNENVFFYTEKKSQDVVIDLSKFNLIAKDDVLLTIETVEPPTKPEKNWVGLKAKSNLFKSNIYKRDASQSEFYIENEPFNLGRANIGFYLMVSEL